MSISHAWLLLILAFVLTILVQPAIASGTPTPQLHNVDVLCFCNTAASKPTHSNWTLAGLDPSALTIITMAMILASMMGFLLFYLMRRGLYSTSRRYNQYEFVEGTVFA